MSLAQRIARRIAQRPASRLTGRGGGAVLSIVAGDDAYEITTSASSITITIDSVDYEVAVADVLGQPPVILGESVGNGSDTAGQTLTVTPAAYVYDPRGGLPVAGYEIRRDATLLVTGVSRVLTEDDLFFGVNFFLNVANGYGAQSKVSTVLPAEGLGSFTPADLANIIAFYDFTNLSTLFQSDNLVNPVTSHGQFINSFSDLSGNGYHFTSVLQEGAAGGLLYDAESYGHPVVRRVDQNFAYANGSHTLGLTLPVESNIFFGVRKELHDSATFDLLLGIGNSPTLTIGGGSAVTGTTPGVRIAETGGGISTFPYPPLSQFRVDRVRLNSNGAGAAKFWVNGQESTPLAQTAGTPPTLNGNTTNLFAFGSGTVTSAPHSVSSVVVAGDLTAIEVRKVELWIASKIGVTI